jgi:hypothetical protein
MENATWVVHLTYAGFGGKPEGNRPLGRPRRKWEGNNVLDLLEIGSNIIVWFNVDLLASRENVGSWLMVSIDEM